MSDTQKNAQGLVYTVKALSAKGSLNLPAEWIQENLKAEPGEHILVIDLPGVDGVVLHKLDPMTSLPNSLRMMIQGMSEAEFEREGAGNASDIDEMNIPALKGE